jgi:xanthosine utilization system XapX-like protein
MKAISFLCLLDWLSASCAAAPNIRSPAPPVIVFLGLLGILLGEQLIPIVRDVWLISLSVIRGSAFIRGCHCGCYLYAEALQAIGDTDHSSAIERKTPQNKSNRAKDSHRRGAQNDRKTSEWAYLGG